MVKFRTSFLCYKKVLHVYQLRYENSWYMAINSYQGNTLWIMLMSEICVFQCMTQDKVGGCVMCCKVKRMHFIITLFSPLLYSPLKNLLYFETPQCRPSFPIRSSLWHNAVGKSCVEEEWVEEDRECLLCRIISDSVEEVASGPKNASAGIGRK